MSYKPPGAEHAREMEFIAAHPERFAKKRPWTVVKEMPRILVVDDDPDVTALLETAMHDLKVEIVLAADGKQALEKINSDSFDLILLDYNMPELNGEQVLEQISKNSNHIIVDSSARLPIITYSAKGADLNVPSEQGFYILDHWQKPMNYADLKKQIIKVLGRLS